MRWVDGGKVNVLTREICQKNRVNPVTHTVIDRFFQQAFLQVLIPIFDNQFSRYSYGFRPKRSAHQAVKQAQKCICEGYRWVVDMDLEKIFDRVNHDLLMARVARKLEIKEYLNLSGPTWQQASW